jgi:hypothetical protein
MLDINLPTGSFGIVYVKNYGKKFSFSNLQKQGKIIYREIKTNTNFFREGTTFIPCSLRIL